MTQAGIQHQLYDEIDKLSAAEQLRLLAAAREMKSARPEGTPWSTIKHLAGTMPDEDAEEIIAAIEGGNAALPNGMPWEHMKQYAGILPDDAAAEILAAIEEDCENIDADTW